MMKWKKGTKKEYIKPDMEIHGNVSNITQNGHTSGDDGLTMSSTE